MIKIMFDTNIFDNFLMEVDFLDYVIELKNLNKIKIYVTATQIKELQHENTPPITYNIFNKINPDILPHSISVLDECFFDLSFFGEGIIFNEHQKHKKNFKKHIRDNLIADSSQLCDYLITNNEKDFKKDYLKNLNLNYQIFNFLKFKELLDKTFNQK